MELNIKNAALKIIILSASFFVSMSHLAYAEVKEYNLSIEKKKVNYSGRDVTAMTVNGQVPGPTLMFKEGDEAVIHVENKMDMDSSIHWHGILLPPEMDGVPYLNFPPIKPGKTFTYRFTVRQSGTYWYHSHSHFQEQRGVYGSIVIHPQTEDRIYDREHVVLLSDWTDEDPHKVMHTLKSGSEWYSLEKGTAQSLWGAFRLEMLKDFFIRELQRMPPMDISDVAYDALLANGEREGRLEALPGETVRLRIINGSATTFFHFEFAGGPMTIIAADGLNVEPLKKKRVLIGVAETYDVLVKVPSNGSYEFRATAHDGTGLARVWLGSGDKKYAADVPKPNLYYAMGGINFKQLFALTPAGAMGMSDHDVNLGKFDKPFFSMNHSSHAAAGNTAADHGSHAASSDKTADHSAHGAQNSRSNTEHKGHDQPVIKKASPGLIMDGMGQRPWSPYNELRALKPTHFSSDQRVREMRFTLDEDMERYVWFLNNKPLEESDYIEIKKGEVVRFIMVNRTMMHHPMHLHGHFFRVINRQGEYSPLKHTVNVAPMTTTVIEFDANESGDWFFHCHLLYHMMSGMARVVHYEGYDPGEEVSGLRPKLDHNPWYYFAEADLLSQMTQGSITISNQRNILNLGWEYGWQDVDDVHWEGVFTWDYYFNRFFRAFAGLDMIGKDGAIEETRGVFGMRYVLPLNVEAAVWVDTEGGSRIMLEKHLPITARLSLVADPEYDTHEQWEHQAGFEYRIHKNLSLKSLWSSEFGWGGGLHFKF